MIWAAIKKAVNSDLNTPLDVTLGKKSDTASNTSGTSSLFAYLKDTNAKVGSGSGPRKAMFTANGTFTVPAGVTCIRVTAIAAGGDGGAGTANTFSNSPGGGGASCGSYVIGAPFAVTSGSSISITVGTGNTVIGSLLTLTKGTNGGNATASAVGSGGIAKGIGASSGGSGGNGGFGGGNTGVKGSGNYGSPGGVGGSGDGFGGGGGGGGGIPMEFIKGGITGDGGAGGAAGANGTAGASYGAGGGGGGGRSNGAGTGGTGGPGVVIIEW